MLLVAGGGASGCGGSAEGRGRPGAGGWRQRHPAAGRDRGVRPSGHAVAGREVQDVRRGSGRVRAGGGVRDRSAQAPRGGGSGREPDPWGHPGLGCQSGRRECGAFRTERAGTGAGDFRSAGAGGRRTLGRGLPGGTRDWNRAGRSDRGACGCSRIRASAASRPAPAAGLGEDQHRAPRIGGWDCGADQGSAGDEPRPDPAAPSFPEAESACGLGRAAGAGGRRGGAMAGSGRSAGACGRELVRGFRDQRARRDRGSSNGGGAWGRCPGCGGGGSGEGTGRELECASSGAGSAAGACAATVGQDRGVRSRAGTALWALGCGAGRGQRGWIGQRMAGGHGLDGRVGAEPLRLAGRGGVRERRGVAGAARDAGGRRRGGAGGARA